jgi:hypothetical protein
LWNVTQSFAREAGYQARHSGARNEYGRSELLSGLGFKECGRLTRQVIIGGEDDEVLTGFFY